MGVALGNATDNIINIDSTGGVTISSNISGASKKLTRGGAGTGTLTLSGVNTYSGDTTISSGKLALSGTGSINNSPNIVLAGGSTFDVTGLTTSLTLASGQGLKATGTATTGTIATSATKGLTTAANSPLQFTAFDGTNAPLTISGAGTVTLASGNVVTVTVAHGGIPLIAGDYTLIAKGASGSVAGTVPASVNVNGDGIAPGTNASLQINGSQLVLHVSVAVSLKYRSKQSGNWNDFNTWQVDAGTGFVNAVAGQTPTSSDGTITIQNGHIVTATANVNADELTVNSGGLLLVNNGVTFTLDDGAGTDLTVDSPAGLVGTAGTINNNGQAQIDGVLRIDQGGFPGGGTGTYAYNQTTGTLTFNNTSGSFNVNNYNFWPIGNAPQNVAVGTGGITMNVSRTVGLTFVTSGGVQGAGNLTLNGLFNIFTGGFVSGSPTYGNASTLQYSTGGTYGRAGEWLPGATSGAGYPNNVQLSATTTLDLANSSTASPFQLAGSLTIDSGSTLQMAGATPLTAPLNVLGNVNNSGTLSLSTAAGGDLKLQGSLNNQGGAYNFNNRAINFEGGATQSITDASGSLSIPYVVINKSGGTVQLNGTDLTTLAPAGGNSITFSNATSTLTLNARTLTLGGTIPVAPAGAGLIGNSLASVVVNDGGTAGDMGTLPFASTPTLNNLSVNRTGGAGNVSLGTSVTVNNLLTLTAGTVTTGANTLIVNTSGSVARTGGYIVGTEQKNTNGGSFTFDVGTLNGYSPVAANATTGSGSLSVKPTQTKQPNVAGANALARYWTLNGTGITTNLTFHYLAGDLSGTEANYKIFKYNGANFTQFTPTPLDTTNHTATLNGVNSFSDWTLAEAASVFGQIQFAQANTNDAETNSGSHVVNLAVQRTGGSSGAVSVDYSVSDGTATTANSDYSVSPATGTLNWAGGDSADKTIAITVNGDTAFEPDETVNLSLSNAQGGATLGSPADATLTITNDDTRPAPNTVYVDDNWAAVPNGTDPDGAGPATEMGYDAFATVQGGVTGVAAGGTVNVYAGTYDEDVAINKAGLSLLGIDAGTKTIRGAIDGDGATIHILNSNVTVAGFTITRLGNNTTDWNNPGLNSAGIAIQGTSITGALIHDNVITGNRTGIDINNSNGHTIRNNVIDDNRTGLVLRNQTDQMTVVENFITNNWTLGVIFLDGSGGTNTPVQSALHSTFSNNNLSGNWYAQIVDRQSGGSLPTPGTTNLKNFRGDWFGTTAPVVTTANSTEPGYAAQIPVEFGGTATPPGGQPDIAGPASANFKYTPFLLSGTDTNVETTPGRGTFGFQGVQNTTVVSPANQNGWVFFDDDPGVGTGSGGFEDGPAQPPLGFGSAFLQVDAQGRHALATAAYAGTRMDDITELGYYSYQNNNDPNTVFAPSLQFDIDYDLTDASNTFQGRLVFEPYLTPATIQQNVWQNWDALAGKWYGTRGSVTRGNATVANPCQQDTPCTWQQVLATFPNAGVRNTATSVLLFKVGGPWSPGFRGNVDDFRISINTAPTTYDFEPLPTLSIDDVTHAEGDSGTTAFTFTVTKTGSPAIASSVDFTTQDGTATTANGDYQSNSGTLSFASNETTKQLTVLVNGDTTFEPDETFNVHLSNASGATITDADGAGTITNDDTRPAPNIVYVDDNWTAVPNGTDPDGAGPATEMGYDAFATIQGGVSGVAASGTVNVHAGNYPEQVTISKSLTLTGEDAATTNITTPDPLAPRIGGNLVLVQVDSGAVVDLSGVTIRGPRVFNGCSAQIFYGVFVAGGANLNLHAAAVRDIRMADPSLFGCQDGNAIRAGSQALGQTATLTVNHTTLTGYQKTGIIVDGTGTTASITNSTLTGFGPENLAQNAIQIGRGAGATVTGNQISDSECNNPVCGPDPFTQSFGTGLLVFSTSAPVTISNNTISNNDTGIYNNASNTTIDGNTMAGNRFESIFLDEGNATISNNTMSGTSNVGVTAVSFVGNAGNSTGTLDHNTITGATTGLQMLDDTSGSDAFVPQLTAHFNRIVATTTAIDNPQSETANFENNWWGCNDGPGNTGCGAVTGTGADFDPWFVLSATATPNSIVPGGTSNVAADMTHNSDGVVPAGTLPDLPVSFTATNGTMSPTSATVHLGAASSTFTSTNSNSAVASVTVDNETFNVPITVNAPSFSIDDVTHAEGNSGTTAFTFTVTKTGATNLGSSVNFATANDTATATSGDYQSNSGTLTFAANETTKQLTVLVNGDTTFEPEEQFFVNLSNAVGATIAHSPGAGTITNDDGVPAFSVNNVSHNEGNSGTTSFTFTVTKTGATSASASVDFTTQDGTATLADNDYQSNSGTLSFASNEATKTVTVLVNGDTTSEANETFTVHLSNASGASISDADGTGTIKNDDGAMTTNTIVVLPTALDGWQEQHAHCADLTSTGSESFVTGPATPPLGTGSFRFQIGADGDSFETIRQTGYDGTSLNALSELSYSTYVTQTGSGGQAPYLLLNIDFNGDNVLEDQLFFEPVYQNGTYSTIFPGDTVPNQCGANAACVSTGQWQTWDALSGGWWSANESAGGPPLITLARYFEEHPTARIINTPEGNGGIRIATGCGGAAWANFDGNTDAFRIAVNSALTRYDFEAALPAASIDDVSAAEGDAGTTPYTFNVTLSGISSVPVTVNYATADGTATAASGDYQSATGSVTFAPGETAKQLTINVNGDTTFEPNETFFVNLTTADGATIDDGQGQGTIQNDDAAPSFSINDVTVSEPQSGTSNATFTVTLSSPSQAPVSVNYSTADGTAHAPDDYDSTSGTLNFASGETTQNINVPIHADALAEGKETFTVNLSNPTPPLTISKATGQGAIVDPVLNGQVIISEFRFRGAGGAQDEFVELYNNTNSDITVATEDGTQGWSLAAIMPDGTSVDVLATIPANTIIPAHAHFLFTDTPTVGALRARGNSSVKASANKVAVTTSGYSLPVEGDLTYDCDIDDGAGVALFRTAEPANFNTGTRLDAAGFNNLTTPLADLFREGAGLTSPGAVDGEYSFVRNLTTGLPKDTNDNAADFVFVATDGGNYGSVPSLLGAPGPENLASPIQRTTTVRASFIDPGCTGTSATPGDSCARYRDTTSDDANNSHFGTLAVRRKFTNNTAVSITQLRFRIVDITTRAGGAEPAGTADLRVRTSQDNPSATKTGGGTVVIRGLTLEEPPAQVIGGGYNSTLNAGTIKLDAPLAPGNSINVEFLVGVQQQGAFRFFITVEATLDGGTPTPFSKQGSTKLAPPVKIK